MDILFISARYIYPEDDLQPRFEELPIFKNITFANKIKSFSQKGNVIVFVDVWPARKKHNKELTEFLEIINNTLLEKILPKIVIKNIINILIMSVKLKTHVFEVDYGYDTLCTYLNILGEERIKNFDYKEGERLISLLRKKLIEKNNNVRRNLTLLS